MKSKIETNPYMVMSLEQLKADALHGVSAARAAWRHRDPEAVRRVICPKVPKVARESESSRNSNYDRS